MFQLFSIGLNRLLDKVCIQNHQILNLVLVVKVDRVQVVHHEVVHEQEAIPLADHLDHHTVLLQEQDLIHQHLAQVAIQPLADQVLLLAHQVIQAADLLMLAPLMVQVHLLDLHLIQQDQLRVRLDPTVQDQHRQVHLVLMLVAHTTQGQVQDLHIQVVPAQDTVAVEVLVVDTEDHQVDHVEDTLHEDQLEISELELTLLVS